MKEAEGAANADNAHPTIGPPSVLKASTSTNATTAPNANKHPTLHAHVLLGNHQRSMKMSSCLQADARSIYLTYWAAGEVEEDVEATAATAPTAQALFGLGLCVKVWTFSAEAGV